MNKVLVISLITSVIIVSSTQNIYAKSRLLVKFRQSRSLLEKQDLYLQAMVSHIQRFKSIQDLESHQFSTAAEADKALLLYQNSPQVIYVERDYRVKIADIPNDELFASQWGLQNTGLSNGINDIDINAPEAWSITVGNSNTVIGIIWFWK